MVSRRIREYRAEDCIVQFVKGDCVFMTLTTPDKVDFSEIRARWRSCSQWLFRRIKNDMGNKPQYVMNFELHPGCLVKERADGLVYHGDGISHGWHIHAVVSVPVDLRKYLSKIRSFGFGRVDVRRVRTKGISEYLTKHALKAYRGVRQKELDIQRLRLVNSSRGLPRLSDYETRSDFLTASKDVFHIIKKSPLVRGKSFRKIWTLSQLAVMLDLKTDERILAQFLFHFV